MDEKVKCGRKCRHFVHGAKYSFATRECLPCRRNPTMPDNYSEKVR